MRKHDAITALKQHADAIKALGATSLYLFGSTLRDGATAASDLDCSLITILPGAFRWSSWWASSSFWNTASASRSMSQRATAWTRCCEVGSRLPPSGFFDGPGAPPGASRDH
jgi:hypothetical protein